MRRFLASDLPTLILAVDMSAQRLDDLATIPGH
jgi:hypothetical protein